MVNFRVDIDVNSNDVQRLFRAIGRNVSFQELGAWLRDEIDPYIRVRIERRFQGEGDDVVGQWLPLAPSTEHIRANKGYPPAHPINVRDHIMKDFLVGVPGDVKVSGTESVLTHPGVVSSPLTKQKIETAQRGKTYPRTPARPVIGLNQADLLFVNSELVRFIFSRV